ncbi:ATP-binding protein [Shewanella abyssi]|uniref:ATP-binding protein n=1 Tax=Shewanella abyssi TaxID=311789 RepID=UPI00200D46A5|nr:ATP-binding protein [Shewanella abyssi]MCL1049296.1 ATP-binding protein [Shewanella abyssi]MCL1049325.1 ATP-binding protein [Shewanella abyssi]
MDVSTGTFHKQYLSSLEASREVAEDIVPYWNSLGLDESIVGQMELCLVEVVNNVFEHAYGNRDGDKFEATSYLSSANVLIVEISDFGQSMSNDVLEDLLSTDFVEPVADDPETWLQSRRGLKIIQQLSDKLEYFSHQNRNTLRLERSAS